MGGSEGHGEVRARGAIRGGQGDIKIKIIEEMNVSVVKFKFQAWMDEPDIVELENKDRMEKMRRKLMRKGEAAKSRKAKARKNKN